MKAITNLRFGFAFCFAVSAIVVAYLALAGMPKFQSGPGALTALGAIPNLIILAFCAIIILICWFTRPKFNEVSVLMVIGTIIGYSLFLTVIFWNSALWGYYTLHVQIVDSKHIPIPGITVDTLAQRGGNSLFSCALLPDDVRTTVTTGAAGIASLRANHYQRIGALINMQYQGGGRAIDPSYRFSDVSLSPVAANKAIANISWSKTGEQDNSNMHQYSSQAFDPSRTTLIIFLPRKDGDDHFDYTAIQ